MAEFFPGLNIFTALAVQKLGYSMYCLSFACLTAFLRKVYCQCKVSALLLLAYCRPAACLTAFLRSVYNCQCTVSALLLLAYCLTAACLMPVSLSFYFLSCRSAVLLPPAYYLSNSLSYYCLSIAFPTAFLCTYVYLLYSLSTMVSEPACFGAAPAPRIFFPRADPAPAPEDIAFLTFFELLKYI